MPKIKIVQEFKFADDAQQVIVFAAGDTVTVSDECARIALDAGWAVDADAVAEKSQSAPANKAQRSPRNK